MIAILELQPAQLISAYLLVIPLWPRYASRPYENVSLATYIKTVSWLAPDLFIYSCTLIAGFVSTTVYNNIYTKSYSAFRLLVDV